VVYWGSEVKARKIKKRRERESGRERIGMENFPRLSSPIFRQKHHPSNIAAR
jgi:hypothetical protein